MVNYGSQLLSIKPQERTLMLLSVGVVLCSILAVIIFVVGASQILFYIVAVIALALGFYLSYSLRQENEQKQSTGRKK